MYTIVHMLFSLKCAYCLHSLVYTNVDIHLYIYFYIYIHIPEQHCALSHLLFSHTMSLLSLHQSLVDSLTLMHTTSFMYSNVHMHMYISIHTTVISRHISCAVHTLSLCKLTSNLDSLYRYIPCSVDDPWFAVYDPSAILHLPLLQILD